MRKSENYCCYSDIVEIVWASGKWGFEYQLYHALAAHPWWVCIAFLSLSFLVYKVGLATTSSVYCENYKDMIESASMYQRHNKITQRIEQAYPIPERTEFLVTIRD